MTVHRVTMGEVSWDVPDNGNLREAVRRQGLAVHRGLGWLVQCGGRGRCGTCRVTLVDPAGASAVTPLEVPHLAGRAPGERLACQVAVRGPLTLVAGWGHVDSDATSLPKQPLSAPEPDPSP